MEYKQLDKLRDVLRDVPFVGLTATATEKYTTLDIVTLSHFNFVYCMACFTFDWASASICSYMRICFLELAWTGLGII